MFIIIFIALMLASWLIQSKLQSKFKEFAQVPTSSGLSGKEVAEKMLRDHAIFDVKVTSVDGFLTDHYNPINKTVNLSPEVYNGQNVSAAAVAAHECGHAVQHAEAYSMLMFRSRLVPVVQFSSNIVQWVLLGGILLINVFPFLLLGGIVMFAMVTIFSLITLPVEFDASRRALAWIDSSRIMKGEEYDKAKNALQWAASTYVIAAVSSVVTLFHYVMIYMGGSRRN